MAKTAGSTRASKWNNNIYHVDGVRHEYGDMSDADKERVKLVLRDVQKEVRASLQGKTVKQTIDNGQEIDVLFTKKGINHFVGDTMLTLSGKYFSRDSLNKMDEIFKQAEYTPTEHGKSHARNDGRDLWFRYTDTTGRGVYFKVTRLPSGQYELYSIGDKIE